MSSFQLQYIGDLEIPISDIVIAVDNDRSYIEACLAVRTAIENNVDLTLQVRTRHHAAWLNDYCNQLRVDIEFSEETPKSVLGKKWSVAIPDWVSEEDIVEQGLLQLDVNFGASKTFEARLINLLLDVAVDPDSPDETAIAELIAVLCSESYPFVTKEYPILGETLRRLAATWSNRTNSGWLAEICKYIPEKIEIAWHLISASAILQSYPSELLDRVLTTGQATLARKIPAGFAEDLPLEASAREEALTQVQMLFKDLIPNVKTREDFRKVVSWISGRTAEEFRLIEDLLKRGLFEPNEEDIRLVSESFNRSNEVQRSRIEDLKHFIRPAYPTLIGAEEDWDPKKWIRWVTEEYAPYRDWQIKNDHYDAALEETVCRFSDWYVEQYANIQADADKSLVCVLNSMVEEVKENSLTVLLMVDCLPVTFFGVIDHALRTSGFNRHDISYRYSALPTVTEFNKPALISGKLGRTDKSYINLLTERSVSDWGQTDVRYVSTLRDLSELDPGSNSMVVLVNHIEGDEIFHSDVESNNRTYEEELARSYAQLTEALSEMCDRWEGPRDRVSIRLLTDHGACRILEEERKTFESIVVSKLFADERLRVATMTRSQAEKVPDSLWEIGYRFSTPFSDGSIHFFPRGHNTVRKAGAAKKYIHGGVAPEEVIVPVARYGLFAIAWKKPFTRFLNNEMTADEKKARFYIQRVVKVQIEIQNPNTVIVEPMALELLSPDASVKAIKLQNVPPGSVAVLSIDLYFQRASQSKDNLELKLRYTIGGDEYEQFLVQPAEFKSAMSGGFSLRDL